MSVIDRFAPRGLVQEEKLLKVCDETGMGLFSVREMGQGGKDKCQVIIKIEENQGY